VTIIKNGEVILESSELPDAGHLAGTAIEDARRLWLDAERCCGANSDRTEVLKLRSIVRRLEREAREARGRLVHGCGGELRAHDIVASGGGR
jgi:hypothetical protein